MTPNTTAKHTPATKTPWHVNAIAGARIVGDETAEGYDKLLIAGPNSTVASVYRPSDARAIVTAVNTYPALVAALRERQGIACAYECDNSTPEHHSDGCLAARAALAQAEGGSK